MRLVMKKLIILLSLPLWMQAQTPSQNYTKKTTYREANGGRPLTEVIYYDGLGRPVQQVANKRSISGKDIVTHIEYNNGRQLKEYLPYPSTTNDMSFQTGAQQETLNYSQYAGQYPFNEIVLEASTQGRPLKQGAQGADWQINPNSDTDHTVKYEYQTNSATEVRLYFAATTWDASQELYTIQLQDKGDYKANQLYKTVTKDENWTSGTNNTTEEFVDKEGKLILKRVYNNGAHDTYYVYDIYDNLTYVIPPLVTNPFTQLDQLCYQYKYDDRNRLVEKKIPGKQWEYLVYDQLDRVVATSATSSPFGDIQAGWLIAKYDALGRIAYSGWMASALSRYSLQSQYNAATNNFYEIRLKPGVINTIDGIGIGYTNLTIPTAGFKLLTVTYYDDYFYPNAPILPTQIEGQNIGSSVVGLPTGSWVRIVTTASEAKNEQAFALYDVKGRLIRTFNTNYLGGYSQVDSKVDFMGKTIYAKTFHKRTTSSTLLSLTDSFTYTDQDQLLLHKQQINGGAEQLIAKNTYDELGQLIFQNIGGEDSTGATSLQKVDYRYNIRGWLTDINNETPIGNPGFTLGVGDLFGLKINYNDVTESQNGTISKTASSVNGKVKPLYNGNISEAFWQTNSDGTLRKYGYQYDNLNRITGAYYQKPKTLNPNPGSYNELVSYDKNGNITSLKRTGNLDNPVFSIDIDDLTYTYDNGNKLLRVNDTTNNPEGFGDNGYGNLADDYSYDSNGNVIKDDNKKITLIKYNHLNLPTEIIFSTGDKINYLYDAFGTKIQKSVTQSGNTITSDYLSGFQYQNQVLKFFSHAEGYVAVTDGSFFNYVYNFTDQTGNVRLSWAWDDVNDGIKIIEENHYYPFGLKHRAYNTEQYSFVAPVNDAPGYPTPTLAQSGGKAPVNPFKYKYNGQEWQDELNLNVTAMDFRQYDNALGRFHSIDLLAESFADLTPYHFSFSSPIVFSDPTGLCPECPDKNKAKEGDSYVSTGGGNYSFNNGNWTRNDGDLAEVVISVKKAESQEPQRKYGGDGSGSFADISYKVADGINQLNPIANLWDVISYSITGQDRLGNKMSTFQASLSAVSVVPALKGLTASSLVAKGAVRKAALTDSELLTKAAQKAEAAVGGSGRFAGTAKHTYANNLITRYQRIYGDRGFRFNQYFNNGVGNRGYLDVINIKTKSIYDYKFGSAIMGNKQFSKYARNFEGHSIEIIRP